MSDEGRDQAWRDELIRLGGSIHQDEAGQLSDEQDAVQQAGIDRYLAMLDALDGRAIEGETIEAILWSLHPLDDYGIYEAAVRRSLASRSGNGGSRHRPGAAELAGVARGSRQHPHRLDVRHG